MIPLPSPRVRAYQIHLLLFAWSKLQLSSDQAPSFDGVAILKFFLLSAELKDDPDILAHLPEGQDAPEPDDLQASAKAFSFNVFPLWNGLRSLMLSL